MGRILTIISLGALSALVAAILFVPGRKLAEAGFFAGGGFVSIAQRGGAGIGPENTMVAAQRSLSVGADVLAFDLWGLRDGALALIHDPDLARTTGLGGQIEVMTSSDLERFDAGYSFVDADGKRPFAGQSIHPPVLDDVLTAFPEARTFLELKHDNLEAADALCTSIKAAGAEGRVMMGSFFDRPLRAFRRACPSVATALSPAEVKSFVTMRTLRLSRFSPLDGQAIVAPETTVDGLQVVTPALVKAAHARNLRVYVYTIDDEANMARLLAMGVDGMFTNRPDLLAKVRKQGNAAAKSN